MEPTGERQREAMKDRSYLTLCNVYIFPTPSGGVSVQATSLIIIQPVPLRSNGDLHEKLLTCGI